MKKALVILSVFCSGFTLYSQNYFSVTRKNNHSFNDVTHFGKIVLGSSSPLGNFTIYEDGIPSIVLANRKGKFQVAMANGYYNFHPKSKPGTLVLRNLTSHNMILSMPNNSNDGSKNIRIADDRNHNTFLVHNNGKVTIGTEKYDKSSYKLYVKGGIKAEEVKVELASVNGWADYVFDKGYNLMSLDEVENYIQKNKRLPEVPSAEQVVKNGVELKQMNALLLKKVEELTLHVIELNKEMKVLKKELRSK